LVLVLPLLLVMRLLTHLLQHLVALVQHKEADVGQVQGLVDGQL
jgi:hypothetical protein